VQEPEEFRTPIPVEFCHAMAVVFWLERDFLAAFVILLMFHGLLRLNEALALTWHDVLVFDRHQQAANGRPPGLLRIGLAKMRGRGLGRQQFVIMRCAWLCEAVGAVRAALPNRLRARRVWPLSEAALRQRWQRGLQVLGLGRYRLLLAGLRGGGAISSYLQDENVPRVRRQGRWAAESTLERYLQEGVYHMLGTQLESEHQAKLQLLADRLPLLLRQSPATALV